MVGESDQWWCFGWNVFTPLLVERKKEVTTGRGRGREREREREMSDVKRDQCFKVFLRCFQPWRERDPVGGEMKGVREREREDEERKEKERNGVARFKIQNESQINLLKCASFLIIFSTMLLYYFF